MTGHTQTEIVVGLDRSPAGGAAWDWASAYSRSCGDRLRAIHVYERGSSPLAWVRAPGGRLRGAAPPPNVVRDELEAMFTGSGPEPDWQLDFLSGHVGKVLLDQSQHARLLVIGTREHLGVDRVVHGSVSHFCLNNANCPVVAVPPGHVGGGPDPGGDGPR
jgi:nucleotide-binding universal stress UspA family protein